MKKILIIGAGFLQAFVIKKAKELGYYTIAVDGNAKAVGFKYSDEYAVINIVDEKACLKYAVEKNVDGVLTAATDYGVLTASYIAQEMNLPGLNYTVAKRIKNKYQTQRCLFENKVDDTEQLFEVTENTDICSLGKSIQYPVMVKPCDGSGSRGASRVDNEANFEGSCQLAIKSSNTHHAVVEKFITGNEYGAESLVVNGGVNVLAIMKKWMTDPPYYAELGHAIPSGLPNEIELRAKECVEKAIKALGVNFGSINMDMLITDDGKVHIVDIGARMGGNLIGSHIIPAGTGIDYMKAMICNAVGDEVDLRPEKCNAVATKLLAFKGGVIKQLPDIKLLEEEHCVTVEHHMNVGDVVNEYHTNLDGCGYIVAVGEDIELVKNNAQSEYEQFCNDIF